MRKGVKKGVHHARLRGNDLGRGLRSISAQKHKEMCGDGNYAHGEKEVLIVHIHKVRIFCYVQQVWHDVSQ